MTGKGMKLSSIAKNFFLRVINTEAVRTLAIMAAACILSVNVSTAQDGAVRPSKSEAQAAWDKGNYGLAYEHYNGLLLLYSRDPLYKYYTGACLVKMERDISRAVTLLGSAINSSVNIKSVPEDVWFYYGRALQMNGTFAQALEAFGRFARGAGRKVAAEYEVQTYIDQCSRGKGALTTEPATASGAAAVPAATVATTTTATNTNAATEGTNAAARTSTTTAATNPTAAATEGTTAAAKAATTTVVTVKPAQPEEVNRSQTPAGTNLPGEYETILAEAVKLQHEADSALQVAGDTARATALQAEADRLFMMLEENESPDPETPAGQPQQPAPPGQSGLTQATGQPDLPPPAYLFYEFEVRPSPAYSEQNPVPVDFTMPPGMVYTVQIAAFRNPVAPSLFHGLYPVFGSKRPGSEATYYYTGLFRRLDDAREALPGARGAGFPDAFVVAMMDGTQVSMERAQLLEKQWASQPLPGKEDVIPETNGSGAAGNMPVGTLSFRAEVMRITKPVKPEVIEKIELLAGSRGLEMIKNSDGETVFLIGNFITFESAEDYVSLLIRNGYSTARVAAYVGMNEIPVEAAIELLNRPPDD